MTDNTKLTKADAVALWHAVDAFKYAVHEMRHLSHMVAPEVMEQERARLLAARRALRKVNQLRRSAA